MLHHSNSRHQRNRGSRVKTLLQATLLVGVVVWLLYQVKHSYDKKNEYLEDTESQLGHVDRSIFQGRKERVGSYDDGIGGKDGVNPDTISKPEEEQSGEAVFEKDSIDSHDNDSTNNGRSEADEEHGSSADGKIEVHSNDEDEATSQSEADKNDAEGKNDVHLTGDDVPQNYLAQEESDAETNGMPHEEEAHGDESTNADQSNASNNGSYEEEGEKKESVDSQNASESLSDDAKTGTDDEHSSGTLPDETGNVPSVQNDNSQNDGSENQGDSISIEEKSETASGDGEKGSANGVSYSNEPKSDEGNAATEVPDDQAAKAEAENSQGASAAEAANGSSEETKPANQDDGNTETSNNGEQVDIKMETSTSTNIQQNESQVGDGSSGWNGSNDGDPEQSGKPETQ
ncbi:hypothetical protein GUJ93_ZPchr0006g44835 [Zizania palustris]|uniref:Uncharacterized protein n=1 Tax=Zizania palustris TaxID=103762 RepID=A0A8J5VL12_ZIZPA|nr:hypothetical protein GUJ93_ZPchr0006g44835 [Zizania palustris]